MTDSRGGSRTRSRVGRRAKVALGVGVLAASTLALTGAVRAYSSDEAAVEVPEERSVLEIARDLDCVGDIAQHAIFDDDGRTVGLSLPSDLTEKALAFVQQTDADAEVERIGPNVVEIVVTQGDRDVAVFTGVLDQRGWRLASQVACGGEQ